MNHRPGWYWSRTRQRTAAELLKRGEHENSQCELTAGPGRGMDPFHSAKGPSAMAEDAKAGHNL